MMDDQDDLAAKELAFEHARRELLLEETRLAYVVNRTAETSAAYSAAQAAVHEHRKFWRQVREAVAAGITPEIAAELAEKG